MPGFYNDGTPKSTIMFTDNMDFTGNFGNPTANFVAAGQLPIGTGVLSPLGPQILVNTLTAGTGINIVNGAGTITISALTAGFVWLDVSGGFGAQKETGYFIIGTSTATLPAVP